MSPHQTLSVAVRLFAIWLAIYWARFIPWFYSEGYHGDDSSALATAVASTVLAIVCLIVLWFFPRTIARGLLPVSNASNAEPAPAASPDTWFSVGSGLLGLFVVTNAIPALVRNLAVMFLTRSGDIDKTNLKYGLLYYFTELILAVWLILGAKGVKNLITWARNAGHYQVAAEQQMTEHNHPR